MHRAQFLAQLERYTERYADEAEVCARFIEFVRTHRDCFERSLKVGHVTGSAWVLDKASPVSYTHLTLPTTPYV